MGTLIRNGHSMTGKMVYSMGSATYIHKVPAKKLFKRNAIPGGYLHEAFVKLVTFNSPLCDTAIKVVTNFQGFSRRYVHTDVRFPSFDDRRYTVDPTKPACEDEDFRRSYRNGMLYGVGGSLSLVLAAKTVQTLVMMKSMPADQVALGITEIKLNEIPEGQCKTYEWRGKPLFVKHRTEDEIEAAKNVSVGELRDPQEDRIRVQKPEWLILVAVCPHLGCVPLPGKGEHGGFFCPCHSSSFDTSGRIRSGPAPSNLEVPPYKFIDNDIVVVGSQ